MANKVLVIQHDPDVTLASFQNWILDYDPNFEIETVYAREDEIPVNTDLPVIILGGENNAYDDEKCPWLTKEKELVRNLVQKDVPILGICLGHQLGCVALGGKVEVSHPRGKEVGVEKLYLSALADEDPIMGEYKKTMSEGEEIFVPEWHSDVVTCVPPNAKILASSDRYIQSVRCGSFLGVQFHPEANLKVFTNWGKKRGDKGEILAAYNEKREDIEKFAKFLLVKFLDSFK